MTKNIATSDIILAATLKVLGESLVLIEKDGPRGIFHFDNVNTANLQAYDLGQCRVEPISFNNAIRALSTAAKRAV